MNTQLLFKFLLSTLVLIFPLITQAVVGEVNDGDVETVACSVSICKNWQFNVHSTNSAYHKKCEQNDSSINWVTEEIVGTSEMDVLNQFRDMYYDDGRVNGEPNTFNTLVKRGWACGADRNSASSEYQGDLSTPEKILERVNPRMTWDSYSYDASTGVFQFFNPGYNGPDYSGYISVYEVRASLVCTMMGFPSFHSHSKGEVEGNYLYLNGDGTIKESTTSSREGLTSISCYGDITRVFSDSPRN